MQFREATILDAKAIAALHAESWRLTYRGSLRDTYLDGPVIQDRQTLWRQRLQDPAVNQHVIVAIEGTALAGFTCLLGNEDEKWGSMLDNLHVAPQHKGKGLGARLMSVGANWLLKHYPEQDMYLWVLETNRSAQGFYDRMGGTQEDMEIWNPPDGSSLPALRYVWHDLKLLLLPGS